MLPTYSLNYLRLVNSKTAMYYDQIAVRNLSSGIMQINIDIDNPTIFVVNTINTVYIYHWLNIPICPTKTFLNLATLTCFACMNNCSNCFYSSYCNVCLESFIKFNNNCKCPDDSQMIINNICTCQFGQIIVNNVCKCPYLNQIFINSTCQCPY